MVVAACLAGFLGWLAARPTPAITHPVARTTVAVEVMGTGTLEARVSASVASKIAGRVETISVDQGDRVEAGQVLARLDGADIQRQVEVARADEAAAEAAVERARADRVKSEALRTAAIRERDRILGLVSKSVASQVDADKADDTVRIAEAGLGAARGALSEAERRRTASTRSREYQEARLSETVIRAPFAGLITRRHREPGDVLVPGSSIFSLVDTDQLWVSAWVDETEMVRLAPDQRARVVFRASPLRHYSGSVARLGREVDRETREFIVDVRVEELPKNWAIGQRAEIFAEVDRAEGALAVPTHLIHRQDGAPGVFVYQEGRSRWRSIQLGLQGRAFVEVSEGLQLGDQVLEPSGERALREGGRVVLP